MRRMLALTCAVLAVQGCKSQKVIAVETELVAAKARLAALDKRRQELDAESRKLQVERKTFTQQADEAALARARVGAASYVLQGLPIPDGIQLDEALRAKSAKLGALAAAIVQRTLPCADPDQETETSPEMDVSHCAVPELVNPCDGVEARNTQEFKWGCEAIVGAGKGPATAVCVASAQLDDSAYPISTPTVHLQADVLRLAFEKKGRLVVADWPPPSYDLYRPSNWSELASCAKEFDNLSCVRECDTVHGRLTSGCNDWEDGSGPDGSSETEEDPEPYDLRAARVAAANAAAEAERARDELSYQECLATCGGGAEPEPAPIARLELTYSRSPAPGLFQFDVKVEDEDGGVPPRTLLISFPALHAELAGEGQTVPEKDGVVELATVLDVEKLFEGPVAEGKRILAGFTPEAVPVGARVSIDGKTPPEILELDAVCDFGAQLKNKRFAALCVTAKAKQEVARVNAEAARAKAEAAKAKADAGVDAGVAVVDAVVDAGVTP